MSHIILFIIHTFIHYWWCCRSHELTCLSWLISNWRWDCKVYSVSVKCTVLPWMIISVTEEEHSFIDFFMSNITPRLAESKWIMNSEPPASMSSSFQCNGKQWINLEWPYLESIPCWKHYLYGLATSCPLVTREHLLVSLTYTQAQSLG